MDKKGFTLIELIAVLGILLSISMLTLPTIIQTISNVKEQQYKEIETQIKQAAEIYVQENRDSLELIENEFTINISDLISANLLKEPLLDPRDNSNMRNKSVLVKLDNEKVFAYTITTQ